MKPSTLKPNQAMRRADSVGVLSAIAVLTLAGPVQAQAPTDPALAAEPATGPLILDSITVTARKREEDILDVPL